MTNHTDRGIAFHQVCAEKMAKLTSASVIYVLLHIGAISKKGGFVKSESTLEMTQMTDNYCPYFKNRPPSPQPDLKNCTWYRQNSCCLQTELDLIFPSVVPPLGANEKCLRYTNFLMCYVCTPDQNLYYKNERLTVCETFCDKWFAACGEAKLKGTAIKDLYHSGEEFCSARKFTVRSGNEGRCFSFDTEQEIKNLSPINLPLFYLVWLYGLFEFLLLWQSGF